MLLHRIPALTAGADSGRIDWTEVPAIEIQHYLWDQNGYKPNASCQLLWRQEALFVRMSAEETRITATYTELNDPVYTESCLELFIAPDANTPNEYLNFEFSPLGTLLVGVGQGRENRRRLAVENFRELFAIRPGIDVNRAERPGWGIEWRLPTSFMRKYFSGASFASGKRMRANFYKCADISPEPHHGSWSPIERPEPDFHQPEFFGTFELTSAFCKNL